MKPIKPVKIFTDGKFVDAIGITVISAFDNLKDEVTFQYSIFIGPSEVFDKSIVTLRGDEYHTWDSTELGAYQLVANKVGFELEIAVAMESENVSVDS